MAGKRFQFRLFDLVMCVILAALFLGVVSEAARVPMRSDASFGSLIFLGIGIFVCTIVWSSERAMRTGPVCQECGRRFLANGPLANSTLCARCRPASLPPEQSRREQFKTSLMLLLIVTGIMALLGLPLWSGLADRLGGFAWIVFPLLALGATLGLVAAVILVFAVVFFVRSWRMRYEKPFVARARKVSGDKGTIERSGPVTVWWCGPVDPVPMVLEQVEVVRKRFEQLIDESVKTPPLRMLVFNARAAFAAYHRNVVADMGQLDGVYAPRPARSMTLSTEITRFRLHDQVRSTRACLLLYLLESYKGFLAPLWIQTGVSFALAHDPPGDGREQLNRRMKVAVANGAVLNSAGLFQERTARAYFKELGDQVDHAHFARLRQFRGQCWSVVEYLAGSDAPPDRLGRFRSFLSDLNRTGSQEAVFERHFGHGFDALLEEWQAWVLNQSSGDDLIPTPEIQTAILERLVPAIRDRSKKAHDRIQAMRALGGAGYVLGADALVDVLRERDDRFTSAATWALESISGLAWGSDADRWSEWLAGRDPKAVSAFEFARNPLPESR